MFAEQSAVVAVVASERESAVFTDLAHRGPANLRHELNIATFVSGVPSMVTVPETGTRAGCVSHPIKPAMIAASAPIATGRNHRRLRIALGTDRSRLLPLAGMRRRIGGRIRVSNRSACADAAGVSSRPIA